MTAAREFLVGHGCAASLSRCRIDAGDHVHGDSVVIRSELGLELAEILCPSAPEWSARVRDAEFVRNASSADRSLAQEARRRGLILLTDIQQMIDREQLPLLALDADFSLAADRAHIHVLRWAECSLLPVQEKLQSLHAMAVRFFDQSKADETGHGCGSCGSGGCSTGGCGEGGCGTSDCSRKSGQTADDLTRHFAELREQMRMRLPTIA